MHAQVSPSAVLGGDLGLDMGPDELAELLSEARLPRDNGARQRGMRSAAELGSQWSMLAYGRVYHYLQRVLALYSGRARCSPVTLTGVI